MTWGSRVARALNIIWVLPLIVTRFSGEEIKLWYSFTAFWTLASVLDLGFNATFIRLLSYSVANKNATNQSEAFAFNAKELIPVMKLVYGALSLLMILAAGFAFFFLQKNIAATPNPEDSFLAFLVFGIGSSVFMGGNLFVSTLQGVNKVALVMKWDALSNFGSSVTSILVLSLGGGILELAIAQQFWIVLNVIRNRWLCQKEELYTLYRKVAFHYHTFLKAFQVAWKSGAGAFMSLGLSQVLALYYSMVSSTETGAAYLITLNILHQVNVFAHAPFYSKLPLLAQLRAKNDIQQLAERAQQGMQWSYVTLLMGFLGIGLFGSKLLELLGSNAQIVSPTVYFAMCIALLVERYGAMHIQIYTTTNHIIWHIANGISGLINLLAVFLLFSKLDVLAFPLGSLAGSLLFYSWYSAKHSYQSLPGSSWAFEKKVWLFPLPILLLFCASSASLVFYPEEVGQWLDHLFSVLDFFR